VEALDFHNVLGDVRVSLPGQPPPRSAALIGQDDAPPVDEHLLDLAARALQDVATLPRDSRELDRAVGELRAHLSHLDAPRIVRRRQERLERRANRSTPRQED
jgi:hypothetical protein